MILPNRWLEFQFMIYLMAANSINFKIGQQALYYVTERSQYPLNRRLGVPQNRSGRFVNARSCWTVLRVESQFLLLRARNLDVPRALTTPLLQKETLKLKLRGLSPRANYTDRAAAAGRRS